MLFIKLLFLFVLLGEARETVGNYCPSRCSCNTTEATCVSSSLTEFPGERFPKQLQKLDISRNHVTKLDAYTIRNWMIVSLKELNLSNNAINIIDGKSLIGQSALQKLDLSGNNITTIPLETFSYPPNLQWLALANNSELKVPEHSPLLESDSLQVLHLEYCNIEFIYVTNLKKLGKLKELYLSHNKIKTLSTGRQGDLLACLKNIRILDISYNQLQELPPEILILPKLEEVFVRNNKLRSLCKVKETCEICEV
jgi:Leucine-rich repeat (LRR) protein